VRNDTKNSEIIIQIIAKNLENLEDGTSFSNPPIVIMIKAHQKASHKPPK